MPAFDLVVRGGTVADGTGGALFEADVAIKDGKIAAVGKFSGSGVEEIAASDMLVTPGFVDIHTHYDGQVTWADRLTPSTNHGVTTVLMGNCGVGFAPCRPDHHDALIEVMEGVEDIPGIVMKEGIPWTWTSFPEYLDVLAARGYDADVATQIPHSALRIYVMGKRGIDREPATGNDLKEMGRLVEEAVRVGAFGFSTSRLQLHRTRDGRLAPSITAGEEEVRALAVGLKRAGRGVIEATDSFHDLEREFALWRRIVEESGRPLSLGLTQSNFAADPDDWRRRLVLIEGARRDGLPIWGQICIRPIGLLYGLTASMNPFAGCPSFAPLAKLALEDKVAELRKPAVRARLLGESPDWPDKNWIPRMREFDNMYPLGDPPNYAPPRESSLAAEAHRRKMPALELAYEALLRRDGKELFLSPAANYAEHNLDAVREMMRHDCTVLGIADGGAHVNTICDAGAPTFLLAYWTRDAAPADRFPVSWAIHALTQQPAQLVGMNDRGVIAPGFKADVNILDYGRLHLHAPRCVNDLPMGGARFLQDADGYVATILSGVVTYRDAKPTGALPGRLVRAR